MAKKKKHQVFALIRGKWSLEGTFDDVHQAVALAGEFESVGYQVKIR